MAEDYDMKSLELLGSDENLWTFYDQFLVRLLVGLYM